MNLFLGQLDLYCPQLGDISGISFELFLKVIRADIFDPIFFREQSICGRSYSDAGPEQKNPPSKEAKPSSEPKGGVDSWLSEEEVGAI